MKKKYGLSVQQRIERHRTIAGECWETYFVKSKTYPAMKIDGRHKLVHRLAYELYVGPIPEGMCVLHKCDNPRCHRPEHLFLGTYADNVHDMIVKGRHKTNNINYTLVGVEKLAARFSQIKIAALYKVSQKTVSNQLRKLGLSRGKGTAFRQSSKRRGPSK